MKSKVGKIVIWSVTAAVVLVLVLLSVSTIRAGHVGVRTQFGAVVGEQVPAGLNFKIPFIQSIVTLDCRVQKVEADANAASKDLQTITSKIAVNFSVNPSFATKLYREVGANYKSVVVDPAIQEVVKSVTANYTAEELIAKRGEVSVKMKEDLTKKISERGITVNDFNVINFEFSDEFNKAIEAKQVAQQQALKAQQDLERIKIEANQKVVQAKAEADALKLQKQEITDELLRLREIETRQKAIEKWDGKLPTYTGDGTPFIDITK